MLGLIATFALAGWTLVYAAVANGGRFAATPWEGLRRSAYDDASGGANPSSGSHGGILGAGWNIFKHLLPGLGPLPLLP